MFFVNADLLTFIKVDKNWFHFAVCKRCVVWRFCKKKAFPLALAGVTPVTVLSHRVPTWHS